jgi:hypothetical protein
MYVDGAKTLITASGIAVALLSCVCLSLIVILALLRGFERAENRYIDEQRKERKQIEAGEGRLNTTELLFILVPTGFALSCFLVGFVFLGRIAFHF